MPGHNMYGNNGATEDASPGGKVTLEQTFLTLQEALYIPAVSKFPRKTS